MPPLACRALQRMVGLGPRAPALRAPTEDGDVQSRNGPPDLDDAIRDESWGQPRDEAPRVDDDVPRQGPVPIRQALAAGPLLGEPGGVEVGLEFGVRIARRDTLGQGTGSEHAGRVHRTRARMPIAAVAIMAMGIQSGGLFIGFPPSGLRGGPPTRPFRQTSPARGVPTCRRWLRPKGGGCPPGAGPPRTGRPAPRRLSET